LHTVFFVRYDLRPKTVFIIETGCVLCEVQAEPEETVEQQT
jgi:hypothetical protein